MIKLTVKQMAAIKRTAMNVLPLTNKKAKLANKIVELGNELEMIQSQIDAQQGYVKSIAGGYTTEELVVRREQAMAPNTDLVTFDENERVYIIREEGDEVPAGQPADSQQPAEEQPEPSQTEVAERMAEAAEEAEQQHNNDGWE